LAGGWEEPPPQICVGKEQQALLHPAHVVCGDSGCFACLRGAAKAHANPRTGEAGDGGRITVSRPNGPRRKRLKADGPWNPASKEAPPAAFFFGSIPVCSE